MSNVRGVWARGWEGICTGLLAEGLWPGGPVLCCGQSWPAESSSEGSSCLAWSPGSGNVPAAPPLTPVSHNVCFSAARVYFHLAKVSVWFGFSIGFSLRHRFSHHPQFLLHHRLSQAPRWEQVGS